MKSLKVIGLVGIFLFTTAFISAQVIFNKKPKQLGLPFRSLQLFSEELGLSEEQQAKLKELRFKIEKETIALRSKIGIAELELRELLQSEEPDEAKIKSKIDEIGELKSTLRWTRVQGRLQVRNTLTSEQLEKLKTFKKEQMKKRFRRRRGFRGRRPFRPFKGEEKMLKPKGDVKPEQEELEPELLDI